MNAALEPRDCPYVGLDPFRREYESFFFGRERDSRVIADSVASRRITVLFGASGVGKSSVLNVGLPAALRARKPDWIIVPYRDWHDQDRIEVRVIGALWRAIRAALLDNANTPLTHAWSPSQLDAALKATKSPLLLILDQFEEYFLYQTRSAITPAEIAFGELLSRRDLDLHVLIAVRDDSLHLLNKLRAVVPFVLEATIQLRHLNDEGASSAIRGPIERYNHEYRTGNEIELDDRLVDTVIGQLREGASRQAGQTVGTESIGIELPYLQLTMTKLWGEAGGRNATVLRVQTLEDLGGVREIARNHVDKILGGLTPKEQALCADIFRYLVTGSGTKIAYPTDALAKQITSDRRQESSNADAATVSTEEVAAVLEELTGGEKRLLRPVKAGVVYELFHDVLGLPILDWRQKFIDNAAREEAEWERQAKEVAEQAARNAINLATKEANARATAEAQLREEAEHRALAETLARTSAEQKHSAEQQARDAAEKAASEAKARAVAETKRATAERQAREAAEKAAHEQKALAINLRNALIAVACVGVAALIGFGVSLYYSREASQQELRAEQLAEHAGRLANDVLTQLDRANRAIAATIDSDLVFEPGQTFAARTRNALWKLARADEAVRSDYIAILTNRPRELARATPGFPQISRSLGTRWPQPDEAERLFATAIDALTLGTSKSLIDAISALKSKLTEAQARQAVDSGLNRLVKTTDAGALRWLGQVIRTLPVKLTDAQAQPVLDFLLEQLGQNTDPQAFVWFAQAIQALPVKLTDVQAQAVLDPVLKRLGQTTDLVELSSLAEAIQILPVELTDAQAQAALAPLLAQLGQTTDPRTLQVARAIQVLALKLTDAQAQAAADLLLKQLGQTTDPSTLQALTQAILALATKLTDAQAQACADLLLKQLAQTTDSRILQAIQALATRLTDAQAQAALAPLLAQLGQTTDPRTLQAFARAIQALAPKLTDAQAQAAADLLLKQLGQTTDPSTLQALTQAIQALATRLTDAQAQAALAPLLAQLGQTTDPRTLRALTQAIQTLPGKLTDAQAQAGADLLLKQLAQTTDSRTLQALTQAIQALVTRLTEAQALAALDPLLAQLGQTTDPRTLQALTQAIQTLPGKLTDAQAHDALHRLLEEVGQIKPNEPQSQAKRDPTSNEFRKTTNLSSVRPVAQALTALAPKLTDVQAGQALDLILKQIGGWRSDDELTAWAQALTALAPKLTDAQAGKALDPILELIGIDWLPSDDALTALAQALTALAPKLTDAQAGRVFLDLILNQIAETTSSVALEALAQLLTALAPKLTKAQAQGVLDQAQASLAWAASDKEAADWARALVALLDRAGDSQRTQKLVAAVGYPVAAGAATDILLEAIRARPPEPPATEAGTNAALGWLAAKYPNILDLPVCPDPPQDFDTSGLQCPGAEGQAALGAAAGVKGR